VDLLDHCSQERGDTAAACRKGLLGAQRRDAETVLLAGLSASMMHTPAQLNLFEKLRYIRLVHNPTATP
jgi:hypothetical protein